MALHHGFSPIWTGTLLKSESAISEKNRNGWKSSGSGCGICHLHCAAFYGVERFLEKIASLGSTGLCHLPEWRCCV